MSASCRASVSPGSLADRRHWLAVAGLVLGLCAGGWEATAVAQPKPAKKLTVESPKVTAMDGWPLQLTYYKQPVDSDAPVVILLHMSKQDSRVWKDGFAETLWKDGYAVVCVDLRKHGESQGPGGQGAAVELSPQDYVAMVGGDLEAVKEFVLAEHTAKTLNMRKMAIVGVEMSATIAVNFAANDWIKPPYDDGPNLATRTPRGQDVRALVLLSPESALPRMSSTAGLKSLADPRKKVAMLFISGKQDPLDKGQTSKMFKVVSAPVQNESRVALKELDVKLRGTNLLGKKLGVEEAIQSFLGTHVKSLSDPWVDRRSRLTR